VSGEQSLFPSEQLVSEGTRKTWRKRVDFILEHGRGLLVAWEWILVHDIEQALGAGRDLSLEQSAKLNEVFHRLEEAVG
jgi:hypothetical protein